MSRVESCMWCPNQSNPLPVHHPGGSRVHIPVDVGGHSDLAERIEEAEAIIRAFVAVTEGPLRGDADQLIGEYEELYEVILSPRRESNPRRSP